jgi:hypothetical protein
MFDPAAACREAVGSTLALPRLLKPLQQAIEMMQPVIEQFLKKDDHENSEGPLKNGAAELLVGAFCHCLSAVYAYSTLLDPA